MEEIEIVYRKISDLTLLDDNPRKISKRDLERLVDSIRINGFWKHRPIALSEREGKLYVLAGHQRIKAAKKLKISEVPTILYHNLTEEQEADIVLRDNINNGEWDFEKLQLIQTAANAVSSTIEEKKTFQTNAAELIRLMKYADRGDIAPEVRTRYEAITAIYGELKKKRKTASNVDLMVEINNIISEYVHVEDAASGMVLSRQFDISQIDFDLLRREFAKTKKKNLVMKDLAELIRSRLDSMLLNNPDRIIYHERYQQIIEDYNSQQDRATIEKTFDELMQIVKDMDQEERRYVREGFSSDEELSLYDMLFSENLSKQDIRKIKAVAVELLQKVKSKIAELDHWTDKQETRSIVYNLIRDDLWSELPACYDDPSIPVYLQRIYEYVYKRYKEVA